MLKGRANGKPTKSVQISSRLPRLLSRDEEEGCWYGGVGRHRKASVNKPRSSQPLSLDLSRRNPSSGEGQSQEPQLNYACAKNGYVSALLLEGPTFDLSVHARAGRTNKRL